MRRIEIIGVAGGRFSLAGGSLKLVGVEAVVKRREKPSGASIENKPPLTLSLAPYHILGRYLSNSSSLQLSRGRHGLVHSTSEPQTSLFLSK